LKKKGGGAVLFVDQVVRRSEKVVSSGLGEKLILRAQMGKRIKVPKEGVRSGGGFSSQG